MEKPEGEIRKKFLDFLQEARIEVHIQEEVHLVAFAEGGLEFCLIDERGLVTPDRKCSCGL